MKTDSPQAMPLADTIQTYLMAKADLANFVDALSDFQNQGDREKLLALETELENAFDQILDHDQDDLTAWVGKLKFLIDEIQGMADVSEVYRSALSTTLANLSRLAEAYASLPRNDRRLHARTSVGKTATFISENSESCSCTVENISFQGLCLTVEDEGMLSDTFKLDGVFEGGVVEAKEVWRNGRTVGARITACVPT